MRFNVSYLLPFTFSLNSLRTIKLYHPQYIYIFFCSGNLVCRATTCDCVTPNNSRSIRVSYTVQSVYRTRCNPCIVHGAIRVSCPRAIRVSCPDAILVSYPRAIRISCPRAIRISCPRAIRVSCPRAILVSCPSANRISCTRVTCVSCHRDCGVYHKCVK